MNETRRRVSRQQVGRAARRAEQLLGIPKHVSVQLILVTDGKMQRLNRRAFRKNRSTDVLAFPLHQLHPSSPRVLRPVRNKVLLTGLRNIPKDPDGILRLGDIVISLPTTERQAHRFHRPLSGEIARLFVHGLLHLLGYDHARPLEASRMEKLTYQILA